MNISNQLKDLAIDAMKAQYGVKVLRRDLITEKVIASAPDDNIYCIYDVYTNDTAGFRVRLYCSSDSQTGISPVQLDRVQANNPNDGRSFLFASVQLDVNEVGIITGTGCPDAITILPDAPVVTSDTADINGAVTLNGTAPANITVHIRWVSGAESNVTASAAGEWQAVSPPNQEDGIVAVNTTNIDGLNSTVLTYAYNDAPDAPVVVTETDLPSGQVTLAGTTENHITIHVAWLSGGATSVTSSMAGEWSTTSAVKQPTGSIPLRGEDDGKVSPTVTYDYITVPNAPIVTTDNATVGRIATLGGTADNGNIVTVTWVDGGTTQASAIGGGWTSTSPTPQVSGDVLISASDSTNTKTSEEVTYGYLAAPAAPVVTGDVELLDRRVTVSGTGDPSSTITLSWILGSDTTVVVDGTGNWDSTNVEQTDGDITATASANGKTSESTTYAYDAPPVAPIVTGDSADAADLATITGTAEIDSVIAITWVDATTTQVAANAGGVWTAVSGTPQPTGSVSLTSTKAGKTSDTTSYDYHARPAVPVVLTEIVNGLGIVTLSGTAQVGSSVSVIWTVGASTSATADAVGNWTILSLADQTNGDFTVSATAYGKTSLSATYSYVDVPNAPVISSSSADAGGLVTLLGTGDSNNAIHVVWTDSSVSDVTVDGAGNWTATSGVDIPDGDITATATLGGKTSAATTYVYDETAPDAPVVVSHSVSGGLVTLNGTAEPMSVVEVTFPTGTVLTNTTDIAGNWVVVDTVVLAVDGNAVITATDADNNTSASTTYTIDITAPSLPSMVSYNRDAGNLVTVTGTAEANSTVNIAWPMGAPTQTSADGSGDWTSVSIAGQTTDGNVTATATDLAGNVSPIATLAIDVTSPSGVMVTERSVDGGGLVTLEGTAEANSTIDVTWSDASVTQVTTNGSGTWITVSAADIPSGNIVLTATDAAGNVSAQTTYVYDETPPAAPLVSGTADANDGLITLLGTAEANSAIDVTWSDASTSQTTADGSGDWTVTSTTLQPNGNMSVTATDADSNVSPATSYVFVDGYAPSQPTVTSAVADAGQLVTLSGTAEAGSTVHVDWIVSAGTNPVTNAAGIWTTTSPAPIPVTVAFSLVVTDVNGNDAAAFSYTYVDESAPAAPVIVTSNTTGGGETHLDGTSEANNTIDITWFGGTTSQISADGSGDWSITAAPKPSGIVSVTATDSSSNVSPAATILIDSDAPNAPIVVSDADAGGGLRSVTGTAEIDSVVEITWPDTSVTTTTADGAGDWTSTSSVAVADGNVSVNATDASGNVSADTLYVIDTQAPAAPVVTGDSNNAGIVTLTGTAEANGTVEVIWPDATTSQTSVDGVGAWTAISGAVVPSGDCNVTVEDNSGNTSGVTVYTTDYVAPNAPVVTNTADAGSGLITLSGTAEANSVIDITWPDTSTSQTTTDGAGDWTTTSTIVVPNGDITLTATDGNSNVSPVTTHVYTDAFLPAAPVVTSEVQDAAGIATLVGTGEVGGTVTVEWLDGANTAATVDGSGDWTAISVTPQDTSGNVNITVTDANALTGPALVHAFTDEVAPSAPSIGGQGMQVGGHVRIDGDGTSTIGNTITVTWPDASTDSTTVDGSGDWTVTSTSVIATSGDAGIVEVDTSSNASSSTTFAFDAEAPVAPVIDSVGGDGSGGTDIEGTAEANSVIDITWPDASTSQVTADGSGDWIDTGINKTSGTVSVTATDAVGNVSIASTVVIDADAPSAPVVTSSSDTGGATYQLIGTAEADSAITVIWPDTVEDDTDADGSGDWTITSAAGMVDGDVTITSEDDFGNVSPVTTYVIDSVAPAAPVVTSDSNDGAGIVTLNGTGEIGATITVTWGDATVDTGTVDGAGDWTITSSAALPQADDADVTATDAANNVSSITIHAYTVS